MQRLIREKITELDILYDHLVLAQISMAGAADGCETKHAVVYTSPAGAYQAIMDTIC